MPDNDNDNEWGTAPPAIPLVNSSLVAPVQQANNSKAIPLQGRPNSYAQAHTATELYNSTFDQALLDSYIARAPRVEPLQGRYNPFDDEHMRPAVEGGHYSTFIKRTILTFKDALDHAIQLMMFWEDEDKCKIILVQEKELAPLPEIDNASDDDAIEIARKLWKEAVSQRNKAMHDWDMYVAEFRLRYQNAKRRKH